jgi:hypothetical protein
LQESGFSERERILLRGLCLLMCVLAFVQAILIVTRKYLTLSYLCNTVIDMANVLPVDDPSHPQRHITVLDRHPIKSAQDAVKSAIVQEFKSLDTAEES